MHGEDLGRQNLMFDQIAIYEILGWLLLWEIPVEVAKKYISVFPFLSIPGVFPNPLTMVWLLDFCFCFFCLDVALGNLHRRYYVDTDSFSSSPIFDTESDVRYCVGFFAMQKISTLIGKCLQLDCVCCPLWGIPEWEWWRLWLLHVWWGYLPVSTGTYSVHWDVEQRGHTSTLQSWVPM